MAPHSAARGPRHLGHEVQAKDKALNNCLLILESKRSSLLESKLDNCLRNVGQNTKVSKVVICLENCLENCPAHRENAKTVNRQLLLGKSDFMNLSSFNFRDRQNNTTPRSY